MEINWKYFIGASFLVCMALLKYGAPVPALVAGVGLAGFLAWKKQRKPVQELRRKPVRR